MTLGVRGREGGPEVCLARKAAHTPANEGAGHLAYG